MYICMHVCDTRHHVQHSYVRLGGRCIYACMYVTQDIMYSIAMLGKNCIYACMYVTHGSVQHRKMGYIHDHVQHSHIG